MTTVYIASWRSTKSNTSGHCLTLDGHERDGGYINTLCDYRITLPASIEIYDGQEVVNLCDECRELEPVSFMMQDIDELRERMQEMGLRIPDEIKERGE